MPAFPQYRLCRWPAALVGALVLGACAGTGPAPPRDEDSPGDVIASPGAFEPPLDSQQPAPQAGANPSSDVVIAAMSFLNVRYRRGGNSAEQGFDCSGFTRHVFDTAAGLLLPRRSREQARAPGLESVKRDGLEPGDLVFFNTLRARYSHVGIYVGEGRFIHAPRSGAAVRIEDMGMAYWHKRYDGARRGPWPARAQAGAARFDAASEPHNAQTPAPVPGLATRPGVASPAASR
ncbi:MAG: C40 family peptidase [Methylibium sp.]|nr:C40 family peptidase [Methylibium sp.]